MCVPAQSTSPMEAQDHAGTLCPTSLAQTVAEGLPDGGDSFFFVCVNVCFYLLIESLRKGKVLLFNVSCIYIYFSLETEETF